MKKIILSLLLLVPLSSHAALKFKNYPKWTHNDRLSYSTFNEGEKWRWHSSQDKPKVEKLSLPERIALCTKYFGAWNYYIDDCSFQEETYILDYINEKEKSEGFHLSAPQREIKPSEVKVDQIKWNNYQNLSPEWQLHFSTFGERIKKKKKIIKRSAPKRFTFVGRKEFSRWNKRIKYKNRRR